VQRGFAGLCYVAAFVALVPIGGAIARAWLGEDRPM
jgi:hypothetical protein